jgi:hypothetical protein
MLDSAGVPAGMDLGQANWFYENVFLPPGNVAANWTGNVATGNAGSLGAAYLAAIAGRVNAYRWMAGLPGGVTLDPAENAADQQAALMMAANGQLSHDPPTSWVDYTAEGADAASVSNLALGASGTTAIDLYMTDPGDNNSIVGHRRWVLYPPTQTMGTGDIPGWSNALDVIQSQTTPVPAVTTIAWPPAGYVPASLIPYRWSVQAPYGSDFSNAKVAVTENGASHQVDILSNSGPDYGGQAIVWDMPNATAPQPGQQTVYTVEINNAVINGQPQSITYTTTAFDPSTTTNVTPAPAQVGFLQTSTQVNATGGSLTVDVARSMNSSDQVSVDYATANGSAVAGTDYVATSGVLTIAPGQYYGQIVVPLMPAGSQHPGGTFSLALSSPTNSIVGPIGHEEVSIGAGSSTIEFAAPQLEPDDDSGTKGDDVTDDATPAFFGIAGPNETVRLMNGTQIIGSTTSDADGNYVVAAQTALVPSSYQLIIVANNSAGSATASLPIFLRIVAPPPTPERPTLLPADTNGSTGGETTDVTRPCLIGTTIAGATIQLLNAGGTVLNSAKASTGGVYTVQVPGPLGVGSYTFRVDTIDPYGDLSSPSAAQTIWVVNPPAPVVTKTTVAMSNGSIQSITVYFSAALTTASADNTQNYKLVGAGTSPVSNGKGKVGVSIRRVVYNALNHSVRIILFRPVNATKSLWLTINALAPGGLRGLDGRYLDASAGGKTGKNAVISVGATPKKQMKHS